MNSSDHTERRFMQWNIGTMGFSYSDWQGVFYPKGVRPIDYLATYSSIFDTLELDTTFHHAPTADRVKKWTDTVPDNFTFCVKTPRAITHDAPIAFGTPAMREFLQALRPMQQAQKLGVVLIQFPPSFPATEFKNLESFLKDLPTDFRFAVEFRHPSWEIQRTFDLLKHYACCWVTGDYGVDPSPIHATTNFLYLRLIGVHEQFDKNDQERIDMTDRLDWWKEQVDATTEFNVNRTYTFVSNDYAGHSPGTIHRLRRLLGLATKLPEIGGPQTSLF